MALISCLCKQKISIMIGLLSILVAIPLLLPVDQRTRRNIIRIEAIIIVEILLTFLSWFIWKKLATLYDRGTARPTVSTCNGSQSESETNRQLLNNGRSSSNHPACRRPVVITLKILTAIFLLVAQFGMLAGILIHNASLRWLSWIMLTSSGIYIQFITCYLLLAPVSFVISKAGKALKKPVPSKRISRVVIIISILYCIAFSIYGAVKASQAPVVKKVDVDIEGLPPILDGIKIALICDVHMGSTVGKYHVDRFVNISNSLKPDIVAVVGDLVDGDLKHYKDEVEPLGRLTNNFGKYFVTGNHEYYHADPDEWMGHLQESLGFEVLHNRHMKVKAKQEFFYIAGTDDVEARTMGYPGHGMDLDKAVKDCEEDKPIILLAHQPKAAKEALDSKYNIRLVLSGHTHGGQMMPMTLLAYFMNPFYAGLYQYRNGHVYVSQGTVYWGIPMRMFSEAELSLITIHSTEKHKPV